MAVSEIKSKFGTSTALTITLASLASSTAGVGRQSTLIDNSSDKFQKIHLFCKVTTGTSPTASKGIYVYLIKADKTASANVITDSAGTSDAGITVVTAQQIAGAFTSSTSNTAYAFDCVIQNPGPMWGIAIVHDTGVALHATGGNHAAYYVGENPEAQ